jgi:hypothetical protein
MKLIGRWRDAESLVREETDDLRGQGDSGTRGMRDPPCAVSSRKNRRETTCMGEVSWLGITHRIADCQFHGARDVSSFAPLHVSAAKSEQEAAKDTVADSRGE